MYVYACIYMYVCMSERHEYVYECMHALYRDETQLFICNVFSATHTCEVRVPERLRRPSGNQSRPQTNQSASSELQPDLNVSTWAKSIKV